MARIDGAEGLTMTTTLVEPNTMTGSPGDVGPNFIFEPN
jgi:hypothetical protein